MISFRTLNGQTFNKPEDALAYERRKYKASRDRMRRGKGDPETFRLLRQSVMRLQTLAARFGTMPGP